MNWAKHLLALERLTHKNDFFFTHNVNIYLNANNHWIIYLGGKLLKSYRMSNKELNSTLAKWPDLELLRAEFIW